MSSPAVPRERSAVRSSRPLFDSWVPRGDCIGKYQKPKQNVLQYEFIQCDSCAVHLPGEQHNWEASDAASAGRQSRRNRAASYPRLPSAGATKASLSSLLPMRIRLTDGRPIMRYALARQPATASYLNAAALLETAIAMRCDAIYPGYGFLAENSAFVERCNEAGLTFIGPDGECISRMGDKVAARQTAAAIGIPVVPGSEQGFTSAGPAARCCGRSRVSAAAEGKRWRRRARHAGCDARRRFYCAIRAGFG